MSIIVSKKSSIQEQNKQRFLQSERLLKEGKLKRVRENESIKLTARNNNRSRNMVFSSSSNSAWNNKNNKVDVKEAVKELRPSELIKKGLKGAKKLEEKYVEAQKRVNKPIVLGDPNKKRLGLPTISGMIHKIVGGNKYKGVDVGKIKEETRKKEKEAYTLEKFNKIVTGKLT